MDTTKLRAVLRVLDYAASDFLFQGPLKVHAVGELVEGFETSITDLVNTGDLSRGNIYYPSTIKPVFLKDDQSYTVLSGQG